jgi:hypothetical protein
VEQQREGSEFTPTFNWQDSSRSTGTAVPVTKAVRAGSAEAIPANPMKSALAILLRKQPAKRRLMIIDQASHLSEMSAIGR